MSKRWTIIAVTVLALMLAGIALAVSRLYRSETSVRPARTSEASFPLLQAVPSDAAAVFCFDGSRTARQVLADSTGLLRAVLAPEDPALYSFITLAGERPMAVSLHNSGSLVPLVVAQVSSADSVSLAPLSVSAGKAGLKSAVQDGLFLASRSETLVQSSRRHLNDRMSVLSSAGLSALSGQVGGAASFFVCHQQAPKLLQVFSTAKVRQRTDFVRTLAQWSGFQIVEANDRQVVMKGTAALPEAASSFFYAMQGTRTGNSAFAEALPYFTDYAVSLPVGDIDSYLDHFADYQDGKGRLTRYESALKSRAGRPLSPSEWARTIQLKEAVRAAFQLDGVSHEVLLVRTGRDMKLVGMESNPYPGYLQTLFGDVFQVVDTVVAPAAARWAVYGDAAAVQAYSDKKFLDYSLKDRLSDADVPVPDGFTVYSSLSEYPAALTDFFSKGLAGAVGRYVTGTAYAPALVSASLVSGAPELTVRVDKRALKGNKIQVLERDTTVVIPTGPFPVVNGATGQTNSFYQNANLYLCLNDENGKGVWGVPFKEPICGYVESIDYYANGKIQFLFAAGDGLYLIDRLGRFVGGFPVRLGKPVLLGPQAYDFTGAHGYTVMVLHKDNTLEMYNLHGQNPPGWKGIHAPETVKSLPELLEVKGKRYWVVRTSIRTLVYPFEGGDPLTRDEGGKMIKPDSPVAVTARGALSVECYDGRTRDIKL